MSGELPLQVLGYMAPILCWVERGEVFSPPHLAKRRAPAEVLETDWLKRELPNHSLDNIQEVIQFGRSVRPQRRSPAKKGFMSPPENYELLHLFRGLGERYFEWSGNELGIKAGYMEEVHELNLRFPVQHLIHYRHALSVATGVMALDRALKLPVWMNYLPSNSKGLRAVINRGLSEGHLHLGGVTSANETWADHMLRHLDPSSLSGFDPDKVRFLVLGRAAVRLLALAVMVWLIDADSQNLPFVLIGKLDDIYRAKGAQEEQDARREMRRLYQEALGEIPNIILARDRRNLAILEEILRYIDPTAHFLWHRNNFGRVDQTPHFRGIRDRIEKMNRLHFAIHRILIERLSPNIDAQDHTVLQQAESADPLALFIQETFYRYIIYQTHHWHQATQSGTTTGLRHFQNFYQAPHRRPIHEDIELHGVILDRLCQSRSMRVVEGRITPPQTPAMLMPWIMGYAQAARGQGLDKFGLVVHFIKTGAQPRRTDPFKQPKLRHASLRWRTRKQAFRLFNLLSTPHPAVPFIVGIDAASLELAAPPEVFAPAFRFLREYPIRLRKPPAIDRCLGHYEAIASLIEGRRLGLTYHVGEDFRHLLSGLRAIDEAITFLRPRPGDRLGHAIALGLKPEVWASQIGYQAVLSKQEWLDTLVWTYHLLGPGHELVSQLDFEDLIQQLSRQVYGGDQKDSSPAALYDSWLLRQLDPQCLDHKILRPLTLGEPAIPTEHHRRWYRVQHRVLREVNKKIGHNHAFELLWDYWYKPRVRKQGRRLIAVEMHRDKKWWCQLCREVQRRMRYKLERRQLVVEVNPSSNRVIGPMARFGEHPIFNLTHDPKEGLPRDIRITINTDDPGVFNTSLAHEYYLLGEVLFDRDHSEPEVVEWLDWLRQNGEDYSFTRPLPTLDDSRMEAMFRTLAWQYRSMPRRMRGTRPLFVDRLYRILRGGSASAPANGPLS